MSFINQYGCCPTSSYCEPALQCYEPKKCCYDECDNTLSLANLQLDQPEICGCGCGAKRGFCTKRCGSYAPANWGSYRSSGCGEGLKRASYSAGCFNDRCKEDHTSRGSFCAANRGKEDRSCRGSYGVGGVWRGQDKCLNFQNCCPDICGKIDYCNECERPSCECSCLTKKVCNVC